MSGNQDMLQEVLEGLQGERKYLPSKYFYDKIGSELFDEITRLKEYYPTRTEKQILRNNIDQIKGLLGEKISLIEPGSGSSEKTRILLKNIPEIKVYVPIDISGKYLRERASDLKNAFPGIKVVPLQADYTKTIDWPDPSPDNRNVVFFPGSTIGNFSQDIIDTFLESVRQITGRRGAFLIGVDLKKSVDILEAAYNDSKEITAQFNKNILRHINRETGSDFNPDNFLHKAFWNEEEGRIEMHLISRKNHQVEINGHRVSFREGESIHTENSHKYSLDEFSNMVKPWFEVKKVWTDADRYFSVQYLEPA